MDENIRFFKISPKFIPKSPINNIPALVQIMAWRRPGDKPLSEPMLLVYWRIYASLGHNELTGIIDESNAVRKTYLKLNLVSLKTPYVHYRQKYGIFGKHNWNTRT